MQRINLVLDKSDPATTPSIVHHPLPSLTSAGLEDNAQCSGWEAPGSVTLLPSSSRLLGSTGSAPREGRFVQKSPFAHSYAKSSDNKGRIDLTQKRRVGAPFPTEHLESPAKPTTNAKRLPELASSSPLSLDGATTAAAIRRREALSTQRLDP